MNPEATHAALPATVARRLPDVAASVGPGRAIWLAIGLAINLAGCAAPPGPGSASALPAAAASAVTGPSARVLLRAAVPADDRFALFQLTDALDCKAPRMLIAGTPQKTPDSASVSAGSLATLDFVLIRGGKTGLCSRWSFTPEAGKTYLMHGLVVGAGCIARLLDTSVADRPTPPADAVLRSVGNQACLPLAQARANAAAGGSLIQGGQSGGEAVLNPRATAKDLEGLIRP